MARSERFLDIPSSSGASFRTLDDDPASTPRRGNSPAPLRHLDERSKLLGRPGDDVFVEYNAGRPDERRQRTSSYTLINTGTVPSRMESETFPEANGDDVGEFPSLISCAKHGLLKEDVVRA